MASKLLRINRFIGYSKNKVSALGAEVFGSGHFLSAGFVTTAEALDRGKIKTGDKLLKSHWREQESHLAAEATIDGRDNGIR
jgi:hypothetical protein